MIGREGHPGSRGLDAGMVSISDDHFSPLQLFLHLAVTTRLGLDLTPNMQQPAVDELDKLARTDALCRRAALKRLGVASNLDRNAPVQLVATEMGVPVQQACNIITARIALYSSYHDFALVEWRESGLTDTFDTAALQAFLAHKPYNTVAVANALCLTLVEALALLRSIATKAKRPIVEQQLVTAIPTANGGATKEFAGT